jgi:hypothetical protein
MITVSSIGTGRRGQVVNSVKLKAAPYPLSCNTARRESGYLCSLIAKTRCLIYRVLHFERPRRFSCHCSQFRFHIFIPESLHASNLLLVHVLVQARVEALPPVEEHRVADELEPRGENQVGIVELLLQALRGNVLCVPDLVLVDVKVDIGLDEEDVVNCASC